MEKNLSGAEIVARLRKGHMVRRACWVDKLFIRICNEHGFDDDGNAIIGGRVPIYTHSTRGYFLHLAYSSQPMKKPTVFRSGGSWELSAREGEGVGMLFADDWEDHGFVTGDKFGELTDSLRGVVMENYAKATEQSIKFAEENYENDKV